MKNQKLEFGEAVMRPTLKISIFEIQEKSDIKSQNANKACSEKGVFGERHVQKMFKEKRQ